MMTMLYGVQKHNDLIFIIHECSKMLKVSTGFALIWPIAIMFAIATSVDKIYGEL
jgi:hypothetical protein